MGLHGTPSLRTLALRCVLLSILSTMTQTLPSLRTDTLLCYICPLQHKPKSCPNVTTQCLPDEVCATSRGFYGGVHVLSGRGCVKRDLCGSHEFMFRLGVRYNVSHTCCCKNMCNYKWSLASLKLLLGVLQAVKNGVNVSITAVQDTLFDSCVNYTPPPMFKSPKE